MTETIENLRIAADNLFAANKAVLKALAEVEDAVNGVAHDMTIGEREARAREAQALANEAALSYSRIVNALNLGLTVQAAAELVHYI